MLRCIKLIACLGFTVCSFAALGQDGKTPVQEPAKANVTQDKFDPATTTVAIVPTVNITGVKWPEFVKKQNERADTYLLQEFQKRGFKLAPAEAVAQAMAEQNIDLTDEEQQRRSTFFDLGRKLNADIIVAVVITHTSQRTGSFICEGITQMKIWLLDVKRESAFIGGKSFEGKSSGTNIFGAEKGSDRQIIAVSNGIRDATAEFFMAYPQVK